MNKPDKMSPAEYQAYVNGPLPPRQKPNPYVVPPAKKRTAQEERNAQMSSWGQKNPLQPKANKYGAKRTVYNGRTFDSKAEAGYAARLDLLIKAGEIKSYQCQIRYPLYVNERLITTYTADFLVTNQTGTKEIHEVKGRKVRDFAMRMKLFQAIHPELPVTVITK